MWSVTVSDHVAQISTRALSVGGSGSKLDPESSNEELKRTRELGRRADLRERRLKLGEVEVAVCDKGDHVVTVGIAEAQVESPPFNVSRLCAQPRCRSQAKRASPKAYPSQPAMAMRSPRGVCSSHDTHLPRP